MTRLTAADLATLRTHPQSTSLYLSIFRPNIIFRAMIDGAVARGEREIPYSSVQVGTSPTDIHAGQTMWVGSVWGKRDKGKVRVKSVTGDFTSGVITVAENSDINWQNGDSIEVLNYYEVWPVYPRIIHDPNNDESVIFYKDYDIEYSSQNATLGTFVNAGPHRAIFRDCASGLASTYWSSTGTYNLLSGTIVNYSWSFEGGTPSTSTSAHPGTVTYDAPGHYVTKLSVTGSNGTSDTTYRYISVYDYPGCGTGTPPTRWELDSLDGSRAEGGYTANLTLHEIIDINEGDCVVLFAEDWYGDTKVSLGGNHPRSASIVFSGYVLDDSIRINYRNSTVEFQAGSVSQIMKQGEGFSCSVESKSSPSTWFELADMDVRRAIYHYLRWHTTVLNTTDVQFLGTDQKIQFFDADRGSLYDAIDSLIRSALVGEVVADRQSKLWLEVSAYAVPNATGTYTSIMDIAKGDWINEPRIDESLSNQTSFIEMGGIAYSGSSTGTFSPLLTNAPGDAPSYRGKVKHTQGLALSSQSQLNQLAGNVLAFDNSRFPVIDMEMAGNYRNLDIAPQEGLLIDIAAEDNMRGRRVNAPYNVSNMSWSWDAKKQILVPRTTFSIITSGLAGQTIPIPPVPPSEGFDSSPTPVPPTFPMPTYPTQQNQIAILISNNPIQAQRYGTFSTAVTSWTKEYDPSGLISITGGTFKVNFNGIYLLTMICNVAVIGTDTAATAVLPWGLLGQPDDYGEGRSRGATIWFPAIATGNADHTSARMMKVSKDATNVFTAIGTGAATQFMFSAATVAIELLSLL